MHAYNRNWQRAVSDSGNSDQRLIAVNLLNVLIRQHPARAQYATLIGWELSIYLTYHSEVSQSRVVDSTLSLVANAPAWAWISGEALSRNYLQSSTVYSFDLFPCSSVRPAIQNLVLNIDASVIPMYAS